MLCACCSLSFWCDIPKVVMCCVWDIQIV
jgi:hypothetical protein